MTITDAIRLAKTTQSDRWVTPPTVIDLLWPQRVDFACNTHHVSYETGLPDTGINCSPVGFHLKMTVARAIIVVARGLRAMDLSTLIVYIFCMIRKLN